MQKKKQFRYIETAIATTAIWQVIYAVLKLTGYLKCNWWKVFIPFYCILAIVLFVAVVVYFSFKQNPDDLR